MKSWGYLALNKVIRFLRASELTLSLIFLLVGFYVIESHRGTGVDILRRLFGNRLFVVLYIFLILTTVTSPLIAINIKRLRSSSVLFRSGIVLLLLSLLIFTGTTATLSLRVGGVTLEESLGGYIRVLDVRGIPDKLVIIGKDRPERFKDVRAIIKTGDVTVLRPFPFRIINGRPVILEDVGISPSLEIIYNGTFIKEDRLSILPPGKGVKFSLSDKGLTMYVLLEPSQRYKKGRLDVVEYDLNNPLYRIVIKKDADILMDRIFKEKDGISLPNGLSLRLTGTSRWVKIRVGSLVEILFICSSLFLMTCGIGAYLLQRLLRRVSV